MQVVSIPYVAQLDMYFPAGEGTEAPMHICYATDNNFAMQTQVSILSLMRCTSLRPLRFYLLDAGISDENYHRLLAAVQAGGCTLTRYPVTHLLDRVKQTGQKSWGDFPTHATWARLFLPEILPQTVSRVLYLDSDIVAAGDFAALDDLDMGEALVAGVEDCVSPTYKQSVGIAREHPYVNAGVLVFNLEQWRKSYHPDWVDTLLTGPTPYPMADQDVINLLFADRLLCLPLRYNYSSWFRALSPAGLNRLFCTHHLHGHTLSELKACRKQAVFVHYNTCSLLVRPWYRDATDPATSLWRRVYEASDWRDLPLPDEPPRLSAAEQKDRRLYRLVGRAAFPWVHAAKERLVRVLGKKTAP